MLMKNNCVIAGIYRNCWTDRILVIYKGGILNQWGSRSKYQ